MHSCTNCFKLYYQYSKCVNALEYSLYKSELSRSKSINVPKNVNYVLEWPLPKKLSNSLGLACSASLVLQTIFNRIFQYLRSVQPTTLGPTLQWTRTAIERVIIPSSSCSLRKYFDLRNTAGLRFASSLVLFNRAHRWDQIAL